MSDRGETGTQKTHGGLIVFESTDIRRVWHQDAWWFSVVDVCGALTGSADAGAYWRKLKQRLVAEAGQPVTFCHGLKLTAADGRQRVTDCANTEGLLREQHKTKLTRLEAQMDAHLIEGAGV